jgi:hypothetical protein
MNVDHWWNNIYGKTEELREKPVPVYFCPLHIHWTNLSTNLGPHGENPVTKEVHLLPLERFFFKFHNVKMAIIWPKHVA